MTDQANTALSRSRINIHFLVLFSGMAALSWEVVWQIKSTLALGVSAWGTAITLAATMGGMSIGALITGHLLRNKVIRRPIRIYGVLEIIIGLAGLAMPYAFEIIQSMDSSIYRNAPDSGVLLHILGIVAVLGIPTFCMGATLPVLGLSAQQFRSSIALLYGLNTLGAAAGTLVAAFVLIPLFGITHVIQVIALINIIVGILAWMLGPGEAPAKKSKAKKKKATSKHVPMAMGKTALIVFVTGFATFVLEIAWFRSLTATFMSTTDAFAIMLSSVLTALGAGAWLAPKLKQGNFNLGTLLLWSGILILIATPVIERFDIFVYVIGKYSWLIFIQWFFMTLYVIGIPVLLLGVALPWILDDQTTPRKWGIFYGLNAFASILGAISAAWIFLPTVGFAHTAWMAGILIAAAGFLIAPPQRRIALGGMTIAALMIAVVFESGVGHTRVQGKDHYDPELELTKVLEFYEGPDVTASVAEFEDKSRILFIDGFVATQQPGETSGFLDHVQYMIWMGHLPMLLHPAPKAGLVIAFGTGQTSNALRNENPDSIDIVDINENIFKLADNFSSNEDVLSDSRVNAIVMDGRAYIRRTDKVYDVITLEPMPPNFAGVNALYSKEFYELARGRLSADGVIAQWLPFHLVPQYYSASIARTFQSVFPNALLWVDPSSGTGILLGSANDNGNIGKKWPGFKRTRLKRPLSEKEVRAAIKLNPEQLKRYGAYGEIIDDNNQLLAYGKAAHMLRQAENHNLKNFELIEQVIEETP